MRDILSIQSRERVHMNALIMLITNPEYMVAAQRACVGEVNAYIRGMY